MLLLVSNVPSILGNYLYLKPSVAPDLSQFSAYNGGFVTFNKKDNKYQITQDIKDLKIYWDTYKITGVVFLKGQYNLCYLEGLYYFLDEIQYLYDDIYRYKVVRWFWVNDCLNNPNLRVIGTLQKTSQHNTVSNNILFTTPAMQSGNELTFYNIADVEGNRPLVHIFEPSSFLHASKSHFLAFSKYIDMTKISLKQNSSSILKDFSYLLLPSVHRDWRGYFLINLLEFLKANELLVWDIDIHNQQSTYIQLTKMYPLNKNKHYVVTSKDHSGPRIFASTQNKFKQIVSVDLSSLTDVKKLSSVDFDSIAPNVEVFETIYHKSKVNNVQEILTDCRIELLEKPRLKTFNNVDISNLNLGDLSSEDIFVEHEDQVKIIVGYKLKDDGSVDPEKPNFRDGFSDIKNSYWINLSKYKIVHSSEEFVGDENSEYINFLTGDSNLFENSSFVNIALTSLPVKGKSDHFLYFLKFEKISLEKGFLVNGKPYVWYACFNLVKSTEQYTSRSIVIVDSAKFKDNNNFAVLNGKKTWWSIYEYQKSAAENPEKQEKCDSSNSETKETAEESGESNKKIKSEFVHLEKGADSARFSKGEIRTLFKDLLSRFNSQLVGNLLDGVIFQFPPNYFSDSNAKNFPDLVSSNFYVDDVFKPEKIDQYVYMQPLADKPNISSTHYNLTEHDNVFQELDKSKPSEFVHNGEKIDVLGKFISFQEIENKFQDWFKYWKDKESDGDFHLSSAINFLTVSENLTWLCYDIFKIYDGKQYKITLLFKRNHNEHDIKTMSTKVTFRRLYHAYLSAGSNSASFGVWYNSSIDRLLWPFYICSMVCKFPLGNWEKDLDRGEKGWSYQSETFIHLYERYFDVVFKVNHWDRELDPQTYSRVEDDRIIHPGTFYPVLQANSIKYGTSSVSWEEGDGLYDLCGTNFYVYKKDKYYELIVKNNSESIIENLKLSKGVFTESPLNDLAKIINSNNILYVFGETIPLKWRGFLNKCHKFDEFTLTPINLEGSNFPYEVLELVIRTDCDFVRKTLQIMKTQSSISTNISIGEYETLSYRIREEQRLSSLNLRELDLNRDKFYLDLRATQSDIDYMINQKNNGLIGGILEAVSMFMINGSISSAAASVSSALKKYGERDRNVFLAQRDYERNLRFGSAEFKIKADRANITYNMAEAQYKKSLLNLETNSRISSNNEASLYQAMKEKFKVGDVFLMNLRPEGRQLEELKKYYEMFGYDIMLNDYLVSGEELTRGLVMKFAQVMDIKGVSNPIIVSAIKDIFESGFRIV